LSICKRIVEAYGGRIEAEIRSRQETGVHDHAGAPEMNEDTVIRYHPASNRPSDY